MMERKPDNMNAKCFPDNATLTGVVSDWWKSTWSTTRRLRPNPPRVQYPTHPRLYGALIGLQGSLLFCAIMVITLSFARAQGTPVAREIESVIGALPLILEVGVLSISLFLLACKASGDRVYGGGVLAFHSAILFLLCVIPAAAPIGNSQCWSDYEWSLAHRAVRALAPHSQEFDSSVREAGQSLEQGLQSLEHSSALSGLTVMPGTSSTTDHSRANARQHKHKAHH